MSSACCTRVAAISATRRAYAAPQPAQEVLNAAVSLMARTADIGPFTNVNVETAALVAAVAVD